MQSLCRLLVWMRLGAQNFLDGLEPRGKTARACVKLADNLLTNELWVSCQVRDESFPGGRVAQMRCWMSARSQLPRGEYLNSCVSVEDSFTRTSAYGAFNAAAKSAALDPLPSSPESYRCVVGVILKTDMVMST